MKKLFFILFLLIVFYANGQCWSKIAAGYNHTIALRTNGTIWGCGNNSYGQLGSGNTTNYITPYQIGIETNWNVVSTGYAFSIARKNDGTIWACGNSFNGQLGNGLNSQLNVFTKIGTASDWQTINAGFIHSIAIKTDNSLWSWGNNSFGQLGIGSTIENSYILNQIGCITLENEEINEYVFKLYPNPTTASINIHQSTNAIIKNIIISDLTGKKIIEQKGNIRQIDVQSLHQGIYFLELDYEGGKQIKKFIKQ